MKNMKRFRTILLTLLPVVFIVGATILIVAMGRGYRFDITQSEVKPTGLLVARSDPDSAQVFVDGNLKTATNNTINIDPGWYAVRIVKEGFIPWQKQLRVQGEVVTNTNAFLFPTNPSLSPLTTNGVIHPTLSPDGTQLAYIVPESDSNNELSDEITGLWVLPLTDQPLSLNRNPIHVTTHNLLPPGDISLLLWSPDSSEILITNSTRTVSYTVARNSTPQTIDNLSTITSTWEAQQDLRTSAQLALLPQEFIDIATTSAHILAFSPDETKILYEATGSATIPLIISPPLIGSNSETEERTIAIDRFYVYDIKEYKNFFVLSKEELELSQDESKPVKTTLTPALTTFRETFSSSNTSPLSWFTTGNHLIVQLPGKIDVMSYDRTNWITIYSGPHESGFVIPWPGSSRLVIMTNFNTKASEFSNLYTVNLR